MSETSKTEKAVRTAVQTLNGPAEIGGSLGTRETGDFIAKEIRKTNTEGTRNEESNE